MFHYLLLNLCLIICHFQSLGSELQIARAIRQTHFPQVSHSGFRPLIPNDLFIREGRLVNQFSSGKTLQQIPRGDNFGGGFKPSGNNFVQRPHRGRGGGIFIPGADRPFGGCDCLNFVDCSVSFSNDIQGCSKPNGAEGVCCPRSPQGPPWGGITRLLEHNTVHVNMKPLSRDDLNSACQKGVHNVNNIEKMEQRMMRSNQVVQLGTPARGHLKFFQITREARSTHRAAMRIAEASESMMRDHRLSPVQGCLGLRQFSVTNTILSQNCPVPPRCNTRLKYRTMDGSCNNLRKPKWGKSLNAFERIIPAKYDDGIGSPRTRSVLGNELPNERIISNHVLLDQDRPDPEFTLSVMQWGQFVDHDLTHAPFPSFDNSEGKECCRDGQLVQPQLLDDCWPITIPPTDEFYGPRNQRCFNFVRSMLAPNDECTFGCREQLNQISSWLDGSNIYGATDKEANKIRDHRTGLLRVMGNNMLPLRRERSHECESAGAPCFDSGDSRVNEQPGLIAIHIFWHREHNRVVNILRRMNPRWSAEGLFQEARRIVVAEYQHIIYNEWLPIIVGQQFMLSFDISPKRGSYNLDYNPNTNPNMNNEFATSAFRFGHTLVQGTYHLFSRLGRQSALRLKDHFNAPLLFHQDPEMVDKFARTFAKQNIQRFDSFITKDLTNHLFETRQTDFGMDLMALNIHRGRDHAIGTYNDMRVICGLRRARNFDDLLDQIPSDTVRRLSNVYQHVDDIDFFVGGTSERPVAGGLLGWTFLCVVGDQFARAKKGDRFFYDLAGQPSSFNPQQLGQIRQASWARILCDNTNIGSVQPLAFRLVSQRNREVPCNHPTIPHVNLNAWRGEPVQA